MELKKYNLNIFKKDYLKRLNKKDILILKKNNLLEDYLINCINVKNKKRYVRKKYIKVYFKNKDIRYISDYKVLSISFNKDIKKALNLKNINTEILKTQLLEQKNILNVIVISY